MASGSGKAKGSNFPWSVPDTADKFEKKIDGIHHKQHAEGGMAELPQGGPVSPSPEAGQTLGTMGKCLSCEDQRKKSSNGRGKPLQGETSATMASGGNHPQSGELSPVAPPRRKQKKKVEQECNPNIQEGTGLHNEKGNLTLNAEAYFEIIINFMGDKGLSSTRINIPCSRGQQFQWKFLFENKSKQKLLNERFRKLFQLEICRTEHDKWQYPYSLWYKGTSPWKDTDKLGGELHRLSEDVSLFEIEINPKDFDRIISMLEYNDKCKNKEVLVHVLKKSSKRIWLTGLSVKVEDIRKDLKTFILEIKEVTDKQKSNSLDNSFLKSELNKFSEVFDSFEGDRAGYPADNNKPSEISPSVGEQRAGGNVLKMKGQDTAGYMSKETSHTPTGLHGNLPSTQNRSVDQRNLQVDDGSSEETDQYHQQGKSWARGTGAAGETITSTTCRYPSTDALQESERQSGDSWFPPTSVDNKTRQQDTSVSRYAVDLESDEMMLLGKFRILEETKKKLKCTYNQDKSKLEAKGEEAEKFVKEVMSRIRKLKTGAKLLDENSFPRVKLNMFRTAKNFVEDFLEKKGLPFYLKFIGEEAKTYVKVYAEEHEMERILEAMRRVIVCKQYTIDSDWKFFFDSQDVKGEYETLQEKHRGKLAMTKVEDKVVVVCCCCDISKEVFRLIEEGKKDFFDHDEKFIECNKEVLEYCERYERHEIGVIEGEKRVRFTACLTGSKYGWTLKGPKGTTERAYLSFHEKILNNVTSQLVSLTEADDTYFTSETVQKQVTDIQSKCKCCVTVQRREVDKEIPTADDTADRCWVLGDGRTVGLYHGDPRQSHCDAVLKPVPPSNIANKPFDLIASSCNYMEAKMFVQPKTDDKCIDSLRTSFIDVLSALTAEQKSSVAVPVNVHQEVMWNETKFLKIMVHTFVEEYKEVGIKDCKFMVERKESWGDMMKVMETFLSGRPNVSIKESASEASVTATEEKKKKNKQNISVWHGELAQQECDVIVNTTSKDLKLSYGAVSNSILTAAGEEIQREVDSNYGRGIRSGEVAVTGGYNLHCRYVFHGALPKYAKGLMTLRNFMIQCLKEASDRNLVSIAFPALGTGNLGYPKEEVAKKMYDTVREFGVSQPQSSVTKVIFVIYQKDEETKKAFEEERISRNVPIPSQYEGHMPAFLVTGQKDDVEKAITELKAHIAAPKKTGAMKQQLRRSLSSGQSVSSNEVDRRVTEKQLSRTVKQVTTEKSNIQRQQSAASPPCVTLSKGDHEKKRLLAYPIQGKVSETMKKQLKSDVGDDVTIVTSPEYDLVMIICNSVTTSDAILMKHKRSDNRHYRLTPFPAQTVVNLKATLNPIIVQIVTDNGFWQDFETMLHNCGVKVKKSGKTAYLKGSLLEIQFAQKCFASMFTAKQLSLPSTEQSHYWTSKDENKSCDQNTTDQSGHQTKLWTTQGKQYKRSSSVDEISSNSKLNEKEPVHSHSYNGPVSTRKVRSFRGSTGNKDSWQKSLSEDDAYVDCSVEEFDNIRFHFSRRIKEVEFIMNESKEMGKVFGDIAAFLWARQAFQTFTKDEIGGLSDVELTKFQEMGIILETVRCKHDPKENRLVLSGKTYGDVVKVKFQILIAIGRETPKNRADRQLEPSNSCSEYAEEAVNKKLSFNRSLRKKPWRPPPNDSLVMTTIEGIEVYVYTADILDIGVDCIVITTDESLSHTTGIAAKVASSAGKDLEDAARELFGQRSYNVGDVVSTSAGNLTYESVIHMVGPQWKMYEQLGKNERKKVYVDDLQRGIVNTFEEACSLALKSVGLPVVSSGKFHVPEDVYHKAVTEAVLTFSASNLKSSLKYIHFVDLSSDKAKRLHIAFEKCCKSSSVSKDGQSIHQVHTDSLTSANGNPVTSPTIDHHSSGQQKTDIDPVSAAQMVIPAYVKDFAAFQVNDMLTVYIYTGDITESLCQAIVCPEDEDLKGEGHIAKIIASKAGQNYEREKRTKKRGSKNKIGDLICTRSGNLNKIEYVIHIVMPVESKEVMSSKELSNSFMDNLKVCVNRLLCTVTKDWKLWSVALPMFGSGIYNPKHREEMVNILRDEILNLKCNQPLQICLVNNDGTNTSDLVKQFEKKLKRKRLKLGKRK